MRRTVRPVRSAAAIDAWFTRSEWWMSPPERVAAKSDRSQLDASVCVDACPPRTTGGRDAASCDGGAAMSPRFAPSKFHAPPLVSRLVLRPRLFVELDRGAG